MNLRQSQSAFVAGLLFALGLGFAGMTQPHRVIGFLNPAAWDPSLLFVMAGAVGVHALSYRFLRHRSSPLFDTRWHLPARQDIDRRLLLGAAIFGVGWGLAGFCPGPGLVSIASGDVRALSFVAAMVAGMCLFQAAEKLKR